MAKFGTLTLPPLRGLRLLSNSSQLMWSLLATSLLGANPANPLCPKGDCNIRSGITGAPLRRPEEP